jgi:tetratricopeptide (TPR) repeat protein
MQGAALAGNMIGQALGQLLFGSPAPPPVSSQPDPEQQQRELAAQQLNNSGLYLLKQKNYAGAINEFQKALATNPNDSNTLRNLAMAKQQQKDAAVAGQTSRALGQFLGNAPANTGPFGFAQLTGSTAANPNASTLSLVNLDSDTNVVDLRGTTKTSVYPESLKGQLDEVLGTTAPPPAAPDAQAGPPQAQDIGQVFQSPASGPAPQSEVQKQERDVEQTTKAIDEALGQNQSADAQQPSAAFVPGNSSGSVSANPATQQPNAHLLDGVANPDFDGRTTGNGALKKFELPSTQPGSDGVDLRGTSRTTVDPARVNGSSASSNAEPGMAAPLPTGMRPAGLATFSAPGAPIFDCPGDRTLITRLKAGLPAQDEAILRTSEALEAAKTDSEEARKKALMAGFKTLNSAAITASELSKAALAKVEGLQAHGITLDAATRFRLLQQIRGLAVEAQELAEGTEGPEKIVKAYKGGKAIGEILRVQKASQGVLDKLMAIEKELRASGVQDDVLEAEGAHLAMYVFGPIGGPIGAALVHTIANGSEFVTQTGQDWNSAAEAEAAERNLSVMRDQERLVRERIYELQQELVEGCTRAPAGNK